MAVVPVRPIAERKVAQQSGLKGIEPRRIAKVGIIGGGTMGQGIAQICAQAGYKTILFDINAQVLEKAEATTKKNLDKGIERGKLTEQEKQTASATEPA